MQNNTKKKKRRYSTNACYLENTFWWMKHHYVNKWKKTNLWNTNGLHICHNCVGTPKNKKRINSNAHCGGQKTLITDYRLVLTHNRVKLLSQQSHFSFFRFAVFLIRGFHTYIPAKLLNHLHHTYAFQMLLKTTPNSSMVLRAFMVWFRFQAVEYQCPTTNNATGSRFLSSALHVQRHMHFLNRSFFFSFLSAWLTVYRVLLYTIPSLLSLPFKQNPFMHIKHSSDGDMHHRNEHHRHYYHQHYIPCTCVWQYQRLCRLFQPTVGPRLFWHIAQ